MSTPRPTEDGFLVAREIDGLQASGLLRRRRDGTFAGDDSRRSQGPIEGTNRPTLDLGSDALAHLGGLEGPSEASRRHGGFWEGVELVCNVLSTSVKCD